MEEGFALAHAISPAKQKTEKRAGKKHDAKGEHRFASGLARCWFGWSHGDSTLVDGACPAGQTIFVQGASENVTRLSVLRLVLVLVIFLVLDLPSAFEG